MKLRLEIILYVLFLINLITADSDEEYDEYDIEDSSEYGVVDGEMGTNCTCGTSNKEDLRIIGGDEAIRNEWPMMAEISYDGEHMCGGTIITERHVLSAAHCVFYPKSLNKLPIYLLDVYIGIHEVKGEHAFENGRLFGMEQFITHPRFDIKTKRNDIGIILLDDVIDFKTRNAEPACLPLGTENIIGDKVKILGWGHEEYKAQESSTVLMKVNLKVQEHAKCKAMYTNYRTYSNICVFSPHKDSCQGDSGGPLLWRDPDTNRYVLVGVVSYGRRCAVFPGVNTNVKYFMPWIQRMIQETAPQYQTCSKVTD